MGRRQMRLALLLCGLALALQTLETHVQARSVSSTTPAPTTDAPTTTTTATSSSSSSSSTATRVTSAPATSSTSATRATAATPTATTVAPTATTTAAVVTTTVAASSSASASASTEAETSAATVKPADLPASSSGSANASTTTTTAAGSATTVDTTYVCTAQELARLGTFNAVNSYLQQTCSAASGSSAYAFPFNGQLSYAQLVAMSGVSACEFYFRGVLLVQLIECEVAGVYVRTTAEAVLELVASADDLPSEAELTAAVGVRGVYNVALRGGASSTAGSSGDEASSPSWSIKGDTIDTTSSASVDGQLLMTSSLQIIGTYYEASEASAGSASDAKAASSDSSDSSDSRRLLPSWRAAVVTVVVSVVLVGEMRYM